LHIFRSATYDGRVSGDPVRHCFLCQGAVRPWIVRESTLWRIIVNRNQNLLGKLCIVLRRHEESVANLSTDEWSELRPEIQWAVDRLTQAFAPDHFNHAFLQNQDAHVHLHVLPRYAATRHFADLQFDDPDYGDHYGLDREQFVTVDFAMQLRSTFDRLARTT
jgi:diadenosine tetraphosphate (Ap4A) HIT family hydrolase